MVLLKTGINLPTLIQDAAADAVSTEFLFLQYKDQYCLVMTRGKYIYIYIYIYTYI